MTGEWPDETDHIDHDRANNRWVNLRDVSRQINMQNSSMRSDNSTGRTGVSWATREKTWFAHIMVNQKYIHLGFFDDFNAACAAREDAEHLYGFHKNHGK
jgi:HNH endonuclease